MKNILWVFVYAITVLFFGRLCYHTHSEVCELYQKVDRYKSELTHVMHKCETLSKLNSLRQTHVENILLNNAELRLTTDQIQKYNTYMTTRFARGARTKPKAIGGR